MTFPKRPTPEQTQEALIQIMRRRGLSERDIAEWLSGKSNRKALKLWEEEIAACLDGSVYPDVAIVYLVASILGIPAEDLYKKVTLH